VRISKNKLRTIIREELTQVLSESSKKTVKKNCTKGNPYHDKNGQLTDKGKATSWSLQFGPDGADCKSGAVRMPGHRSTQKKCGRACKTCGNKADFKCKDGTKVDEDLDLVEEGEGESVQLQRQLKGAMERIRKLEAQLQQARSTEMARCLRRVDVTQRAAAGDLFNDKKN